MFTLHIGPVYITGAGIQDPVPVYNSRYLVLDTSVPQLVPGMAYQCTTAGTRDGIPVYNSWYQGWHTSVQQLVLGLGYQCTTAGTEAQP